jgi:threonine synthase
MQLVRKTLNCEECGNSYPFEYVQTSCHHCDNPLSVTYHWPKRMSRDRIKDRARNMWRYLELLPIQSRKYIISLGEGWTPLNRAVSLGRKIGLKKLWIKDESSNPTGSFKARGLSMAVSRGFELGLRQFAIPTAGNAGRALSAYCAKEGLEAHVYMPEETPESVKDDCVNYGADINIVKGNISDCASRLKKDNPNGAWFDISTMKEPYRLEGKKTMGFEIAEQLGWKTPDVIIYPTGGGTGLIGIWKAFKELRQLGWIDASHTRMVAVQVEGCAPVVDSFKKGLAFCRAIAKPVRTLAYGLRVPKPYGDRMVMRTIYESNGTAVAVSNLEIERSKREANKYGVGLGPEGAACLAALSRLIKSKQIDADEEVVILNTGAEY